jgi:hypothetical protein
VVKPADVAAVLASGAAGFRYTPHRVVARALVSGGAARVAPPFSTLSPILLAGAVFREQGAERQFWWFAALGMVS